MFINKCCPYYSRKYGDYWQNYIDDENGNTTDKIFQVSLNGIQTKTRGEKQ
jgi:hypothetical protein